MLANAGGWLLKEQRVETNAHDASCRGLGRTVAGDIGTGRSPRLRSTPLL